MRQLLNQPSAGVDQRLETATAWPWLRALLTGRWAPVLALIAGLLMPLAFAPFEIAWLAVPSPALLFAIAAAAPRRRALWAGYLYGLGSFGVGVSWVYVSMQDFGSTGILVSGLITAGFVALLALFPLLAVYLGRLFGGPRPGLTASVALPATWVFVEWVRTWFLTGFPWLLLGYSQIDSPLAPIASVFGVLGVSVAVVFVAGQLARLLLRPSSRRVLAFVGVGLLALGAGYAANRHWTHPVGKPIKVALLQGDIPQEKKWQPDYVPVSLNRYRRLTEDHWGADLIVWPETAVPALFSQVEDGYLGPLARQARAHHTDLLIGIPSANLATGAVYNSVVSLGTHFGFYRKRHLVPFGEYVPFRKVLGQALDILGAPMSDFTPGPANPPPLRAAGHPIGVSICYEAAFGEEIARELPRAQLLVNVSNDAWFGDSIAPFQHLEIARMRSVETGRPLLRATNTGISAVVDAHGRIVARFPQFKVGALTATVRARAGETPYVRWRDAPVLILLIGIAALLAFVRVIKG